MCNNQEMDSRVDKEGKKSCENTMLEVVAPSFSPAQGKGANILDFKAIFES